MAFVIKYHILFEVRIFHGFHIKDEVDFYGKTELEKAEELIDQGYNILNDIEIFPTDECQKLLRGHRLKFKASSLGFFVGVETTQDIRPKIPIAEGTVFYFRIRLKNKDWSNISNVKLKPEVNANFFFTNFEQFGSLQNTADVLRPTLSLQHPNFNANRPYEMGEIIFDGADLKRAIQNTDGTNPPAAVAFWETINDVNNVSYSDQKLLPSRFNYQIQSNDGVIVDDISVDLIRSDSSVEKSITIDSLGGKKIVNLDFRRIENERQVNLPAGEYTLDVTSTSAFSESKIIHINDDLFDRRDWAVVAVKHQAGLGDYRILEDDGNLRNEGGSVQHPMFEIRIKNRATYWRYIFHPSNTIAPGLYPGFDTFSDHAITTDRFPLNRFPNDVLLEFDGNKLPHPDDLMVRMDDTKSKFLSEIYLPKI